MYKRYQYRAQDGIKWTDWFEWDGPSNPSIIKGLEVEYSDNIEE